MTCIGAGYGKVNTGQEEHEGNEEQEEEQLQLQVIEGIPGSSGRFDLSTREPFQLFAVAVQVQCAEVSMPSASFMSFMLFMSFLFRLLENLPTSGVQPFRTDLRSPTLGLRFH